MYVSERIYVQGKKNFLTYYEKKFSFFFSYKREE